MVAAPLEHMQPGQRTPVDILPSMPPSDAPDCSTALTCYDCTSVDSHIQRSSSRTEIVHDHHIALLHTVAVSAQSH